MPIPVVPRTNGKERLAWAALRQQRRKNPCEASPVAATDAARAALARCTVHAFAAAASPLPTCQHALFPIDSPTMRSAWASILLQSASAVAMRNQLLA